MRMLFISAGHSNQPGTDRGAQGNGLIEGVETARIRSDLAFELRRRGLTVITDPDNSVLTQTLSFARGILKENDISLDIHFNAAGNTAASGVETIIPSNPSVEEVTLAGQLSKAISGVLNLPLRGSYKGLPGVKTELETYHKSLGFMRLKGTNLLIEVCFLTNPMDVEAYQRNYKSLIKALADVLSQTIKPSNATKDPVHIVQAGESLWKIASAYGIRTENLKIYNNLTSDYIQIGQKLRIPL